MRPPFVLPPLSKARLPAAGFDSGRFLFISLLDRSVDRSALLFQKSVDQVFLQLSAWRSPGRLEAVWAKAVRLNGGRWAGFGFWMRVFQGCNGCHSRRVGVCDPGADVIRPGLVDREAEARVNPTSMLCYSGRFTVVAVGVMGSG